MSKKLALFITHGMGEIKEGEFNEKIEELTYDLEKYIGNRVSKIHFQPIYFQNILQPHQEALFNAIRQSAEIDWIKLRKFMLYSFSDAASLEHRPNSDNSAYTQTQERILDAIVSAYNQLAPGNENVIILAHSLGGQVISNYIWDAQVSSPNQGIWRNGLPEAVDQGDVTEVFARLIPLKALYTTGCNIPIFVAGRNHIQSIDNQNNGYSFEWHNFYDADDILGWPLKPLGSSFDPNGTGISYSEAITADHEINANSSLIGLIGKSWNPLSHGEYWGDKRFLKQMAETINNLL